MTNKDYEQHEKNLFAKMLNDVEIAPLADRKEAKADYFAALNDTDLIAERIGWLLNGSYGYGACKGAWEVMDRPHTNRSAALGIFIAALEWNCPSGFARAAWRELSPEQQITVNKGIEVEIEQAENRRKMEGAVI